MAINKIVEIRRRMTSYPAIWFCGSFASEEPKVTATLGNNRLEIHRLSDFQEETYKTLAKIDDKLMAYEVMLPEDKKEDTFVIEADGEVLYKGNVSAFPTSIVYIDSVSDKEKYILISAWGVAPFDYEVSVPKIKDALIRQIHRYDVNQMFNEKDKEYLSGFEIRIPSETKRIFPLEIVLSGEKGETFTYTLSDAEANNQKEKRGLKRALHLGKRAIQVLATDGLKEVVNKVKLVLFDPTLTYMDWVETHEPDKEELDRQREEQKSFALRPKFSIVIPLYRTDKRMLKELIESLLNQTYDNWEVCFADAGADDKGHSILEDFVGKYQANDERIKYQILKENKSISENTNEAIAMMSGDYVVFCDHDDTLALNALYECAKAINADADIDVIYSDQDMMSEDSKLRYDPLMKPDFSIDFLRSCNYISHLFVAKKELMDEVGVLNPEYNGSQDYDFTLRCVEKAKRIYHIPKVLYHWRAAGTSTADDPATKTYAYESGKKALDAHYKRVGIPATAEMTEFYGKYHTIYHWDETPMISIIIPNKDHIDDLNTCVMSLLEKSEYKNFEIVVVENNSEEEKTFAYYKDMEAKYENFRTVYYEGNFNYSKINNFGVAHAKGDYILLLNNDTEIIRGDFLQEMLGYCMREDVGGVGARLYYEDGSIQHCGVVMGYGQKAGHVFLGFLPQQFGMLGRVVSAQNYSAVTAACLMTKRSVFEEVGGLTEEFAVAFNDVDFCLKIRKAGYLIVYNPFAEAYHYESKSRGYEDTPEKMERFERESELLRNSWPEYFEKGDPYYSPNLTLDRADFSLKF